MAVSPASQPAATVDRMGNRIGLRACLGCVWLLAACAAPADAEGVTPRVRPVDTRIADALSRGRRHSATLAALLDVLERSDLIVHLDTRWFESRRVVGETRFIGRAAGQRYVRISIDARVSDDRAIAVLGHELQHAREIAQTRWVIDEAGLAELYGLIGHRAGGGGGRTLRVDTQAGPDIERQVLLELRAAERRRGVETLTAAD